MSHAYYGVIRPRNGPTYTSQHFLEHVCGAHRWLFPIEPDEENLDAGRFEHFSKDEQEHRIALHIPPEMSRSEALEAVTMSRTNAWNFRIEARIGFWLVASFAKKCDAAALKLRWP